MTTVITIQPRIIRRRTRPIIITITRLLIIPGRPPAITPDTGLPTIAITITGINFVTRA